MLDNVATGAVLIDGELKKWATKSSGKYTKVRSHRLLETFVFLEIVFANNSKASTQM